MTLTKEQIAVFCRSLGHLHHAGTGHADGLALLAEDETDPKLHDLLTQMAAWADEGAALPQVCRQAACFPADVCGLLEAGEQTGRTEETLMALADYYDGRARLQRQLRTALLQPLVLTAVLLAVVVILLVWVLPVFNDVYVQLGSRLTGLAGGLLLLGSVLRKALPYLAAVLVLVVVVVSVPALRRKFRRPRWDDRGLQRKLHTARFMQALSMGLRSGMTDAEAVSLAMEPVGEAPAFRQRCEACLAAVDGGLSLPVALRESELLTAAQCRLLETARLGGTGEAAMEQLARRLLDDSSQALEERTARVEPAVVAVLSVLVGVILLSVMVPLMQIMTTIG